MSDRAPRGAVSRPLAAARAVALSPVAIGFLTACCLAAGELRRYADVEPGYPFVGWNLFLAWIPLTLACALSWAAPREAAWFALPTLAVAWIVFLPNAPYLVTDMVI